MAGGILFHGPADDVADVIVSLVGDDALRVVVQFAFAVGDVLFKMAEQRFVQLQFILHHLVALEKFDGIPAQIGRFDLALDGFLDVGDGVFHAAAEHVRALAVGVVAGEFYGLGRGFHAAFTLERADFHAGAAERAAEFFKIDGIAILAHEVDHVDRDHHRIAQLDQLRGQVEIALDVRAVDDVQNRVGMLADQIAARDDFFRRIGGE